MFQVRKMEMLSKSRCLLPCLPPRSAVSNFSCRLPDAELRPGGDGDLIFALPLLSINHNNAIRHLIPTADSDMASTSVLRSLILSRGLSSHDPPSCQMCCLSRPCDYAEGHHRRYSIHRDGGGLLSTEVDAGTASSRLQRAFS